jgi:hypothetical protein
MAGSRRCAVCGMTCRRIFERVSFFWRMFDFGNKPRILRCYSSFRFGKTSIIVSQATGKQRRFLDQLRRQVFIRSLAVYSTLNFLNCFPDISCKESTNHMSKIRFDDPELWGNEAADDEDPAVLNSYFVTNPAWHDFLAADRPLQIARARKGLGKSALLRECGYRHRAEKDFLVVALTGADLVAQREFKTMGASEHIYDWQQRICTLITRSIGASIGFAYTDDQIAFVEAAELAGLRSRNLVGALVDRLKGKLGPVELQKLGVADAEAAMARFLHSTNDQVLILIDDIDATFTNTPQEALRLSTFFTACRHIATSYKGVKIRTVVRSDVWASIRRLDEALDKVEQYIFDIKWSNKGFRSLLSERIVAHCNRLGIGDWTKGLTKDKVISLIFQETFPWGNYSVHPSRVIHVYSAGRPRWATQLCRLAGAEARRSGSQNITFGNLKQTLDSYGRIRLDDLTREHRHQCPTISDIVGVFAKQPASYTTTALSVLLQRRVVDIAPPMIDFRETKDSIQLAQYLYRIGFILAIGRDTASGNPEYHSYEEMPELLGSSLNVDQGMRWRIHPAYHAALDLTGQREL